MHEWGLHGERTWKYIFHHFVIFLFALMSSSYERVFLPPVETEIIGGKKTLADPEGFPSKLGPATRQRPYILRNSSKMKEILKDLSQAWPAGWPRQN